MEIEIEVSQEEGGLVAAPRVPRGTDVAWIFTGGLAGRKLEVLSKGDLPPTPPNPPPPPFAAKPTSSNAASGQPFPFPGTGVEPPFEYEIFEIIGGQRIRLDWANSRNGGCVKFPDPPKQS